MVVQSGVDRHDMQPQRQPVRRALTYSEPQQAPVLDASQETAHDDLSLARTVQPLR